MNISEFVDKYSKEHSSSYISSALKSIDSCTFGDRIKQLRLDRGIKITALLDMLGISNMTYYNYENGKRVPDIDFALKISLIYNVSMDYLIGLTDNPDGKDKLLLNERITNNEHNLESVTSAIKDLNDTFVEVYSHFERTNTRKIFLRKMRGFLESFNSLFSGITKSVNKETQKLKLNPDCFGTDDLRNNLTCASGNNYQGYYELTNAANELIYITAEVIRSATINDALNELGAKE